MSKYRNICFTQQDETLIPVLGERLSYVVWQVEVAPTTGQHHLQGYCEFTVPLSFSQITSSFPFLNGAHLEPRKGTQKQAIDYCKKEETRFNGPFELGYPKQQGARSDIIRATELVKESGLKRLAEDMPDLYVKYNRGMRDYLSIISEPRNSKPIVIWVYGPTGVGKSRLAWANSPDAYPKDSNTLWWDSYDGVSPVILDEFVPVTSQMKIDYLNMLFDRYPMRVQVKGSYINFNPSMIWVLSNFPPEDVVSTSEQRGTLQRRITITIHMDGTNC